MLGWVFCFSWWMIKWDIFRILVRLTVVLSCSAHTYRVCVRLCKDGGLCMGQNWGPTVGSSVGQHEGGWLAGFTTGQLYWQEVGLLCPHIPLTDVWQRKYFNSWTGRGGKIYVLRYITLEVGESSIWIIFYMMRCGIVLSSTGPEMFSHCILFKNFS